MKTKGRWKLDECGDIVRTADPDYTVLPCSMYISRRDAQLIVLAKRFEKELRALAGRSSG